MPPPKALTMAASAVAGWIPAADGAKSPRNWATVTGSQPGWLEPPTAGQREIAIDLPAFLFGARAVQTPRMGWNARWI